MHEYGWSLVKACADQDIEAATALARYPQQYESLVARCQRQMGKYGASMVKACADEDIKAEEALKRY